MLYKYIIAILNELLKTIKIVNIVINKKIVKW